MNWGLRQVIWWLIRGYQLSLSAILGRHCRFEPSCSHYTQQAVMRHGVGAGLVLGFFRICRCGPFTGQKDADSYGMAFDPVPEQWQSALPFQSRPRLARKR